MPDQETVDEGYGLTFSELPLIATNTVLGASVMIGPFSMIGREGAEPVTIGDRTVIEDHVLVEPGVSIGEDCFVGNHCRIGKGSILISGSRFSSGIRGSDHTSRRHRAPLPKGSQEGSAISPRALIASNAEIGDDVQIGPFAIVGWEGQAPVKLGAGTKVEPFALIEPGVTLGEGCLVDAYCRIAEFAAIGSQTQVLYGAAVFEKAEIGRNCIIGGNVADRTVIQDCVTHFGEIAHDYRNPGDLAAWDTVEAPSPTIRAGAVVGQNSIIVGNIDVGEGSYVGAGEVVRCHVPAEHLLSKGKLIPLSKMRGFVRARSDR